MVLQICNRSDVLCYYLYFSQSAWTLLTVASSFGFFFQLVEFLALKL